MQLLEKLRDFLNFSGINEWGKNDVVLHVCKSRVSTGFTWVGRVSPGHLPTGFLLRPGPVPDPGRLGPGLTRRAYPGFKTLVVGLWKEGEVQLENHL
jgi:hypothetical protein